MQQRCPSIIRAHIGEHIIRVHFIGRRKKHAMSWRIESSSRGWAGELTCLLRACRRAVPLSGIIVAAGRRGSD